MQRLELKRELAIVEKRLHKELTAINKTLDNELRVEKYELDRMLTEPFGPVPDDQREHYQSNLNKNYGKACSQINSKATNDINIANHNYLNRQTQIYNSFAEATGDPVYFEKAVNGFEKLAARLESGNSSVYPDRKASEKYKNLMLQNAEESRTHYKNITGQEIPRHHHRGKGLEGTIAVLGILGGIILLPANMTGNVIVDLTPKATSFLGVGLFLVGLMAGFFWFKGRN